MSKLRKTLERYTYNKNLWDQFKEVPAGRLAMMLDELLYTGYIRDIIRPEISKTEVSKMWVFPLVLNIKDRTGKTNEYKKHKVDDLFRELRDELEAWAIAQLIDKR